MIINKMFMDGKVLFLILFYLIVGGFSQSGYKRSPSCPRWPNTFGKQEGVCKTRWAHAYVHDGQGRPVASNIDLLKRAVREGWNIKVDFVNKDLGIITTPWRAYIKGSSVCAEALVHLGVQWSFLTKCTNGEQGQKTYLLDTEKYAGLLKSKSGVTSWFVRKEGFPVVANYTISDLDRGAGLRLTVDRSNETNPLFSHDSTKIAFMSVSDNPAIAESMWVHAVDYYPPNAIFPSSHNDWRFRRWFTNGTFEFEDQPIASSEQMTSPNTFVSPATWHIDPCWSLVYVSRSNQHGDEWGSLASLLWYIKQGHRVKAIFQGVSVEADSILIRNNHITAQFVSQVARDRSNMMWVWQLVTTTGRIQTVTNNIGTAERRIYSDTYERIEWYVDTRRWREILSETTRYRIICGSRSAYSESVKRGHDIRLALNYREYSVYVTPDSVGMDPNLQASFNRGIGYDIDWKSRGEFKFHIPTYWDFLFLRSGPSRFSIQRLRRIVGTRIPVIGPNPALRSVQWFVSW